MEECGEVVQMIGKIFRHGLDSSHPTTGKGNRDELTKECADVACAIKILTRDGIIDRTRLEEAKVGKTRKFRGRPELLHHVKPL